MVYVTALCGGLFYIRASAADSFTAYRHWPGGDYTNNTLHSNLFTESRSLMSQGKRRTATRTKEVEEGTPFLSFLVLND